MTAYMSWCEQRPGLMLAGLAMCVFLAGVV